MSFGLTQSFLAFLSVQSRMMIKETNSSQNKWVANLIISETYRHGLAISNAE